MQLHPLLLLPPRLLLLPVRPQRVLPLLLKVLVVAEVAVLAAVVVAVEVVMPTTLRLQALVQLRLPLKQQLQPHPLLLLRHLVRPRGRPVCSFR